MNIFRNTISQALYETLFARIRALSSPMEPLPTDLSPRLHPFPEIKAVLFDVYGTLFISGTGDISLARDMSNQQALTEALRQAGFTGDLRQAGETGTHLLLQSIQTTHSALRNAGTDFPEVEIRDEWKKVLDLLTQQSLLKGEMSPEAIMRVSVEYECRVNPVWPMPGAMEILQTLQKQDVLLGIVSNAQFYTQLLFPAFLENSHIELGFRPELCAWSYQLLRAKPSKELFRGIVERLGQRGIQSGEILYVGNDMLNDIWTASQMGLKTALFAGDQRSLRLREEHPQCVRLQPDMILTHLSQLYEEVFRR